jgi:hypothetical protein
VAFFVLKDIMPEEATTLSEEKLVELHEEFIREFDEIQTANHDLREQSLNDRRFCDVPGAQWEDALGEQFANKPKPEINLVHGAVQRIENEYRNNRITVDFVSRRGERTDSIADVADDIYRADEADTRADEAYDNAFDEGTKGGFGAWRLRAIYEDEESDEEFQRPAFEPIHDADSRVYFDLGAKRQDKSDAKRCYVLVPLTRREFEERYPDETPSDVEKLVCQSEFDWETPDYVYIAEVYQVESIEGKIFFFRGIDGEEIKVTDLKIEDERPVLEATGHVQISEKKVKRQRVRKLIMSGQRILEDAGYVAGKYIPIIPFYGIRSFIDGIERFMGHVRLAKDPQQLKNMAYSMLEELLAYSPVQKPIFTPEQIGQYGSNWARDGIDNPAYQLINPVKGTDGSDIPAGPVGFTKPPDVPPALAAILQMSEVDIRDILGKDKGADELISNISGKAVELIQGRIDIQSFIYISNFAKAIQWCGNVWLHMQKDLAVEKDRKVKTLDFQGDAGSVVLNRQMLDSETGEVFEENDFSTADLDVYVEVGPSSSSKREATVSALREQARVTTDPETLQVLNFLTMMNMEGEGLGEVRGYFRSKLVDLGVLEPTEEELKEKLEAVQNAQPDPQVQLANALSVEAEAKAGKAQADAVKTLAETEKIKAEIAEIFAGIDQKQQENIIKAIQLVQGATAQPQDVSENQGVLQ